MYCDCVLPIQNHCVPVVFCSGHLYEYREQTGPLQLMFGRVWKLFFLSRFGKLTEHACSKKVVPKRTLSKNFHCSFLSHSHHSFFFTKELISLMLHVNTEARYTAAQILSHPWVSVSKLHFTYL